MKITVFGATGGIRGHVVRQALDAGHKVTPVVRDPARFDVSHPALEVATVPGLTDPEVLRPVLEASDAAISGVGPVPKGESFVNRRILLPFISAFARDVYVDLAEMEDEIRRSTTEWTIVRHPLDPLPPYLPAERRDGQDEVAPLVDELQLLHDLHAPLQLLTQLCLCWLAGQDKIGVPLGYGKHFDSLEARRTEPPSVLLFGIGVAGLRIDQHVHAKQCGSLAYPPDKVPYGDQRRP